VQPQQAQAGHALARPGLADDAERLTALNLERQAVDGLYQAVVGREVDVQVFDVDERARLASDRRDVSRRW
jgi:hypothetical protein